MTEIATAHWRSAAPGARARRRSGALARLRDADQAADHVAAGADLGLRDDRGRARGSRAAPAARRSCVGGALACGGASALNHVLDRDIDRLMGPRTASRPVAAGRITAGRAVVFGLGAARRSRSSCWPRSTNLLAAALALAGGAFYVLVYTLLAEARDGAEHRDRRRRGRDPAARRMGGRQRASRARRGWLFLIVLLWTPPHFWALALLLERHYAAADVPMLPVVRGAARRRAQVLAYSVALSLLTLLPGVARHLRRASTSLQRPCSARSLCARGAAVAPAAPAAASALFHFSLLYLALLFVAVAIDAAVR